MKSYDALLEAGASQDKARAAAEVIPWKSEGATKADLHALESRMWRMAGMVAAIAIAVNTVIEQWLA